MFIHIFDESRNAARKIEGIAFSVWSAGVRQGNAESAHQESQLAEAFCKNAVIVNGFRENAVVRIKFHSRSR